MAKTNKGRKLFATTATAALVASAIVPVASAAAQINDINSVSSYAAEAVQNLVDRGVITGDQKGNFNPKSTVTRAEAATVLAKALELKVDGTINFSDVKNGAWYYDAIAKVVSNGIFKGQGPDKFNPTGNLTRSEAAIIFVHAFELEGEGNLSTFSDAAQVKTWAEEALSIAVANGVVKGDNGKLNPNSPITKQDFAVMFERAEASIDPATVLTNALLEVKATNEKLTETVTAENVAAAKTAVAAAKTAVTKAEEALKAAKAAEVLTEVEVKAAEEAITAAKAALEKAEKAVASYEESLTVAKVESVSATNLKQVVVNFNTAVDKATAGEIANYSITQGSTTVAVEKVAISEDGRSALLTVVNILGSQKEHKLTVSNVKSGDKVLNQKDIAFTPVDTTLPTVSKVEALGNKTVRVSFSEPVQPALTSNFTIDGKVVVGSIKTADNTVILKLSSVLTDGEHTITSSDVKDYANFVSVKTESKFNVVEDKEAPTVAKVVSATFEKVVLQFSEPIEQVLSSNVYWMQGASKKYPDVNGVKQLSDDTYEFTFSGTNKIIYATDLYVTGVKDYSGNEIAKDTKVQINPVVDQTRPEVLSAELDKDTLKTVKVKFSKALNVDSAKKTANYVIKDKDGKVQFITNNIQLSDGNKTAELTLVNKLADNNEYTLTINGVSDNTTLQNVILPYTTTLTVKDVTAPTLTSIKRLDRHTLVVDFNEAMATSGDGNVLDPAKYTFVNGSTKYVPVDLRITGDSKSVVVTFDKDISTVVLTATVKLVKDVAGNYIAPLEQTKTIQTSELVSTGIKSATATGTKTIVVEFDRPLQSLNADDFNFFIQGSSNNKIVNATLSSDGKKATFTLENHVPEDALNLKYSTVARPTSQDSLGGTLEAKTVAGNVADKISATLAEDSNGHPKVVATGTDGKVFTLTFNENVEASAGLYAFITVKDANGKELSIQSATVTGTSKDLVITLSNPVIGGTATIAIKENPLLTDTVGNNVAEIETVQVDNIVDTTAPTVTTKLVTPGTITADINHNLVFSEPLNTASKAAVKAAVDAKYVAAGTAVVTSSWNAAGTTLTVVITGTDAQGANQVVVSAIADIAVTDLSGNTSAALAIQN